MNTRNSLFASANRTRLTAFAIAAALVSACSLTVPSETSLFGGGGKVEGGGSGGEISEGGDQPGGGGGGAPQAGASSAGAHAGGAGGTAPSSGGAAGEDEGAAGAAGEPGLMLPKAVLLIHYDFDDLTQLLALDKSGNGKDGTLNGLSLPLGVTGHLKGALSLDGTLKQYVQLPADILDGKDGVSVAAWIKLSQALAWDRLFDFNQGESSWFYFSPTGWNDNTKNLGTRCATRTTSALAPEIMMTETISVGFWHHVAVVFAKPVLRYYLDGALKSEIDTLSFGPSEVGKTNQNWIGRSVFAADPYLSGLVDDFRVYSGALTSAEIAELAAQ